MQSKHLLISLFALALAAPVLADDNPLGTSPACGPAQDNNPDSRSPQSVVQALYEIVSGPAGAKKDWERMDKLFAPGAIVTPTSHREPGFQAAPQTPRQFAALRHASIVEIVNGKKNPSWSTIDSILEGLELTLGEFAYYYDSITENDILEYKKKLKEKTSGQAKTPKQIKKARN